jgi:hypothetical protein
MNLSLTFAGWAETLLQRRHEHITLKEVASYSSKAAALPQHALLQPDKLNYSKGKPEAELIYQTRSGCWRCKRCGR